MRHVVQMKFEESLKMLDRIIEELEDPNVSLEDSMNFYKQGTELISSCRKELAKAEMLVTVEDDE